MARLTRASYTNVLPTSLVVNGLSSFGFQLAKTLSEQGGYVIVLVDLENLPDWEEAFAQLENVALVDYSGLARLTQEIRRLDYVFYLSHEQSAASQNYTAQDFLVASGYLSQVLELALEFQARFLFTDSIQAHRYLLDSKGITVQLLSESGSSTLKYTQAEFLRYAETLIAEYQEKKKLVVKVLRLGELMGEDIPLDDATSLRRLLGNAVTQQPLLLQEDGLQSEYYVHTLDAVYAVIKAQFTRGSELTTYSVSYPETVSELALAYKIQELEPDAGELKFAEEQAPQVQLRLHIYKPAPNLAELGWVPKVSFEKALLQSLQAAKAHLFLPTASDGSVSVDPQLGPLARLIAERQAAGVRPDSAKLASSVAAKRKQTPLRGWPYLKREIQRIYDRLGHYFQFLQNLTITEALVYLMLTLLSLGLVIGLLSPIVRLGLAYSTLTTELARTETAVATADWSTAADSATRLEQTSGNLRAELDNLAGVFSLFRAQETRTSLLFFTEALRGETQALQASTQIALAITSQAQQLNGSLVYRPTNSSLLGVNNENSGGAAVPSLNLALLTTQAESGLLSAEDNLALVDSARLPAFMLDKLTKLQQTLPLLQSLSNDAIAVQGFLEGTANGSKVGVALVDQQRPGVRTGRLMSLGTLDVRGLQINAANLQAVSDATLPRLDLQTAEFTTVANALRAFGIDPSGADSATALALAPDRASYQLLLQRLIAQMNGAEVDYLLVIDSSAFATLLQSEINISLNGQRYTAENYLALLAAAQRNSLETRNLLATGLLAETLAQLYNNRSSDVLARLQTWAELVEKGSLSAFADFSDKTLAEDILLSGVIQTPSSFNNINEIALKQAITPAADQTIYTAVANFAAAKPDQLLICLPRRYTELSFLDLAVELLSRFSTETQNCAVAKTTGLSQLNFTYKGPALSSDYRQTYRTTAGTLLRYDIDLRLPGNLTLQTATPDPARQQDVLFYTGEMYNQMSFNLKLINND